MKLRCPLLLACAAIASLASSAPAVESGAADAGPGTSVQGDTGASTNTVRPWAQGVERWMNYLRTSRPEEYGQLTRLREENPEAFRAEVRERMQQLRTNAESRNPAREPDRVVENRAARADRGERRVAVPPGAAAPQGDAARPKPAKPPVDPATERHLAELRRLAEAYRKADSDEARRTIEAQIRAQVAEAHDKRERARADRIAQLENEIARMRTEMDKRVANRDRIIARRVDEVLGRAPPPAAAGRPAAPRAVAP